MNCEACGGDGLIEVGAYRGDEDDTTTRECRLCGGVIATPLGELAHSAVSASVPVAQVTEALPRLFESTSGSRRVVEVITPRASTTMTKNAHGFYKSREPVPLRGSESGSTLAAPCYSHSWKERMFSDVVEYECGVCAEVAIFSRTDGSLVNPADISEIDKLSLSSRTMVRYPVPLKKDRSGLLPCSGDHNWLLVRPEGAGKVMKCSACGKESYHRP